MELTRCTWEGYTSQEKKEKLTELLSLLDLISKKKHPLWRTRQQGKLAKLKKEAVTDIRNIIDWEKILTL